MNKKIMDLVIVVLGFMTMIDGFESEFSSPTPFDIIKWICFIILVVVWIVYRKEDRNG